MPIHWRSETDIQEENRYGSEPSPVRATAIMTVKCLDCGGEITEVHFSDGHRSFVEYGVREVLGEGARHGRCPK
jgi:hypothetical protein